MHTTNSSAVHDTWFALNRHDEEPAKPPSPTFVPPPPGPDPAPEPASPKPSEQATSSDMGEFDFPADTPLAEMTPEQQVQYWRHKARKHELESKQRPTADKEMGRELAELRRKAHRLDEIEEAQKTDAERLVSAKEAAEARATVAIQRAVRAEIKALAANDFADPTDAESAVDPAEFVDDKGDVDVAGIKAKLAELLDTKPHWRKVTEPAKPKVPKPDPGQGPRNTPTETDFKNATPEEFAAELAKHRLTPRS